MSLSTSERAALHFPSRLSDLLRQQETLQALLTVRDGYTVTLDQLEEQTGVSLRYSTILSPDGAFRGRIYETIRDMVERLQWNASQIADYLAQTYNM